MKKKGQLVIVGVLVWIVFLFIIVFSMPTIQGIVGDNMANEPMFQIVPFAFWFIIGIVLFRVTRPGGNQ